VHIIRLDTHVAGVGDGIFPWRANSVYSQEEPVWLSDVSTDSWTANSSSALMEDPTGGWWEPGQTDEWEMTSAEFYYYDSGGNGQYTVAPGRVWTASQAYVVDELIYAHRSAWVCTGAGTVGATEPVDFAATDPLVGSPPVTDGTVTWTWLGSAGLFTNGALLSALDASPTWPTFMVGPAGSMPVTVSVGDSERLLTSGAVEPAFVGGNNYIDNEILWRPRTGSSRTPRPFILDFGASQEIDGRLIEVAYYEGEHVIRFAAAKFETPDLNLSTDGSLCFVFHASTSRWRWVRGYNN